MSPMKLHRIKEVMRATRMSSRALARKLGRASSEVELLVYPGTDLRLSELYALQRALETPLTDLLLLDQEPFTSPIQDRAALVRLMKHAQSIKENCTNNQQRLLARNLEAELLKLMPELATIAAWQSVGQRRTLDEPSAREERPIRTDGIEGEAVSETEW